MMGADDGGNCINNGYLPKHLIWQTLQSMAFHSILPSYHDYFAWRRSQKRLPRNYIPNISLPVVLTIISQGFINMHPMLFFGITLPHGIDDQFIGQLKKFLIHGTIPTHTGCLCNISLEQPGTDGSGNQYPILEASFDDYGHLLTFCWIKILGNTRGQTTFLFKSQNKSCQNYNEKEIFIMERLIISGSLTVDNEIHFSHCCLAYQEAMTIADVIMGDKSKVTKHALELS
jgi:hypothetical protein